MVRDVTLTDLDGTRNEIPMDLPGRVVDPPPLILFNNKVYRYAGRRNLTSNKYDELQATVAVEHKELKPIAEAAGEVH